MASPLAVFAQALLHAMIGAGVGVLILAAYRDIRRRWPVMATVVALGVLLRAATGLALFWISYLDVPVLDHLHEGNGFWRLAPDARLYFEVAADASERGLATISSSSASPTYVRALALWMKLVGVSPASALFLNLASYVLICTLVLRLARRGEALAAPAAAASLLSFTLSPALVLVSAQSLKDAVFVALISVACAGWLMVAYPIARRSAGKAYWLPVLVGFGVLSACAFLIAGVRPYYALFVWGAAASALVILSCRGGPASLWRHVSTGVAGVALIWTAFMFGAGPYYDFYSPSRFLAGRPVASTLKSIDSARESFVLAGGNTNIVVRASRGPRKAVGESAPTGGPTDLNAETVSWVQQAIVGAAALFVPISLLKALSIVDFAGGRGLLFITDADTIFFDLTLMASLGVLLAARRRNVSWLPLVWFAGSLAVITALAMAYVVTNFGTMFRLRLMVATPIWMLPALLASQRALFSKDPSQDSAAPCVASRDI